MTNIDIAKGIIFQKLGVEKETFEDRLSAQKKIYLLQRLGIDLGYSYNWYVHGPYSPELTNYLYNNLEMLKQYDFSLYMLSEGANSAIEKIKKLENDKTEVLSSSDWLELLASYLYLYRAEYDESITKDQLIKLKPKFCISQVDHAVACLKSSGLIN